MEKGGPASFILKMPPARDIFLGVYTITEVPFDVTQDKVLNVISGPFYLQIMELIRIN